MNWVVVIETRYRKLKLKNINVLKVGSFFHPFLLQNQVIWQPAVPILQTLGKFLDLSGRQS